MRAAAGVVNPQTFFRGTRAAARALVVCALATLCACDRPASQPRSQPAASPGSGAQAAPGAQARVYTVNGTIEQLPDPAVKGSMLQVHHEDIPGFVSREGTVVGMNAMTMPFPPAPGVSLAGLKVGDAVELTFEVRWDRIPPQQATAIRRRQP